MANTLSCSIIGCRLDYCNALLYGITRKNFDVLQRVQNSLARVVCNAPYRSPSQPLLKSLHWLPVIERVEYKLAAITYKTLLYQQPTYLFQHINQYKPTRSLRSSWYTLLLHIPPTRTVTAARAFCVSAPTVWNNLPSAVRESSSLRIFLRLLKGHLFQRVFGWPWLHPAPLYHRLHRHWITAPSYKSKDWLIDWLIDWMWYCW